MAGWLCRSLRGGATVREVVDPGKVRKLGEVARGHRINLVCIQAWAAEASLAAVALGGCFWGVLGEAGDGRIALVDSSDALWVGGCTWLLGEGPGSCRTQALSDGNVILERQNGCVGSSMESSGSAQTDWKDNKYEPLGDSAPHLYISVWLPNTIFRRLSTTICSCIFTQDTLTMSRRGSSSSSMDSSSQSSQESSANDKPKVIGVYGIPGSGKTTLLN